MWNAHVRSLPPLVSDRMLPGACREFARAHGEQLMSASLHPAFQAHLRVLWEHNLLHRDDVQDCLLIAVDGAAQDEHVTSSARQVRLCKDCVRPLHKDHCALSGRARGAAAWPLQQAAAATASLPAVATSAAVLPGGLWQ